MEVPDLVKPLDRLWEQPVDLKGGQLVHVRLDKRACVPHPHDGHLQADLLRETVDGGRRVAAHEDESGRYVGTSKAVCGRGVSGDAIAEGGECGQPIDLEPHKLHTWAHGVPVSVRATRATGTRVSMRQSHLIFLIDSPHDR